MNYIFFNTVWDDLLQEVYPSDEEAMKVAKELSETQGTVMVFRFVDTVVVDDDTVFEPASLRKEQSAQHRVQQLS